MIDKWPINAQGSLGLFQMDLDLIDVEQVRSKVNEAA